MEKEMIDKTTETIVAISTAVGTGGVAIIRLSGSKSLDIAKQMCVSKSMDAGACGGECACECACECGGEGTCGSASCECASGEKQKTDKISFVPNMMHYCTILADKFADNGYVVYFKAPKSFTGEDIVEFQVHGGVTLADGIVKKCIALGARMATKGEFSKRAFLNGKLSLEAAEGLIDVISAQSEKEIQAGYQLLNGKFLGIIKNEQKLLLELLTDLNVAIDYPSEDIEYTTNIKVEKSIKQIYNELKKINATYSQGKVIKNGVDVCIVGRPNAGKSSLLNALSGEDCAIVSAIAGTTRDLIKHSFLYNGLKINLIDTAGLTETDNEIEKIGVEKALNQIKTADMALYVVDGSVPYTTDDVKCIEKIDKNKLVLIINKLDIMAEGKKADILKVYSDNVISISTKNGTGLAELKETIFNKVRIGEVDTSSVVLTNQRHFEILNSAIAELKEILEKCSALTEDILADMIQQVYNKLGEVTGEIGSGEIIDNIFANFCLGK